MIKSLLIKTTAVVIGLLLLIHLLNISTGIPVSLLTKPYPELETFLQTVKVNPQHAYAHEQIAWHAYKSNDNETAKKHAITALANNPSDGLAMAILITVYDRENNPERAREAAQLAAHLWPAHDISMWIVADFWMKNNNVNKAMSAWNIILTQQPQGEKFTSSAAARHLFPLLNTIAQHENSTQLFQPYHAQPPAWWDAFFQFMVEQPNNLEAVERFYQQARLNGHATTANKKRYLSSLIQENQWTKAYKVWKDSLSTEDATLAALIYDGSFEGKYINDDFNWILANMDRVQVYFDTYSRADGNRSLRVAFNTWVDVYWSYIRQYLVLPPGNYTLSFQTRANLDSLKGLKWRLGCYQNREDGKEHITTLADSSAISGDFDWKEERFSFTVPDSPDCEAQKLFLISAGDTLIENRLRGNIWFDNFKIIPMKPDQETDQ